MLLGLYLIGVAVPITLAIITVVFWVLTKALKEYVTKEVKRDVEEIKLNLNAATIQLNAVTTNLNQVTTNLNALNVNVNNGFEQIAADIQTLNQKIETIADK